MLEKVNRRAARFVTNNFYRTSSVSSMIHKFGWQQLETRRHNSRLCFLFKIIHNLTCVQLSDITSPNTTATTESTITTRSHMSNVLVPFARTDTYQYSFGPNACNIWNNLPNHIKEITCFEQFKTQINQL